MKKTSSAASPTGKHQNNDQEILRSVVTQLRAKTTDAPKAVETDVDLDMLRAAIDELPEMNASKLVSLHRRIVNGNYRIDSERLAEKLLELESSLDPE